MFHRFHRTAPAIGLACAIGLAPFAGGCANLPGFGGSRGPGNDGSEAGAGAAPAGAVIAKKTRNLGALSGAGGAGGGYLIGASQENVDQKKTDEAKQASDRAAKNPATENDIVNSDTADLNHDGFVTLDEVVAMQRAGLSDREMIDRLRRTNEIFELTPQQRNYLRDRGITRRVIDAMLNMNPGAGPERPSPVTRASSPC